MNAVRLLLLSLFIFSSFAKAAPTCESVFSRSGDPFPTDVATLTRVADEQRTARAISKFLMTKMGARSSIILKENKNQIIDLDVLCIGAGPQCAAASLELGKTSLRSMVVEKTEYVAKTFAEKDFYINSSEEADISMHDFPGGFGSLSHLTSQKYAHSSQLAAHIQAQQFVSGVPVLLGTRIVSTRMVKVSGEFQVELQTDQGVTLRAKTVILGTGLGEIGTKVKDPQYQKAYEDFHLAAVKDPTSLQPVMSTDLFLATLKKARQKKVGVPMPRDIILMGNGDGSRISIEALADSNIQIPKGFKVQWIGNVATTANQFRVSQGGWDRYLPKIVTQYEKNRIFGVEGRVEKVERLPSKRYLVSIKDPQTGQIKTLEGDMIIDCTGYTNKNDSLIAGITNNPELVDVMGPLKELDLTETVLARQYQEAGGEKLPIYVVGPAAGILAKEIELVNSPNSNGVAIFNTVARTSQFVAQLIGVKASPSFYGKREGRPETKSAVDYFKALKQKAAQMSEK